jgi:hypothetical protein
MWPCPSIEARFLGLAARKTIYYTDYNILHIPLPYYRLCGLVVRDPGYISRGPRSIPNGTRISEK